jgi:hypothetical protein
MRIGMTPGVGRFVDLAIASAHRATIYTLDRGMATAGHALGVPVELPGT